MCLIENGRIGSFGKENYLIWTSSVPNHHTHPFSRSKRQNIDQFIDYFLLLQGQLNVILGLFDETVTNRICKVDKADLIRTTPLKLVFHFILDHVVTHRH